MEIVTSEVLPDVLPILETIKSEAVKMESMFETHLLRLQHDILMKTEGIAYSLIMCAEGICQLFVHICGAFITLIAEISRYVFLTLSDLLTSTIVACVSILITRVHIIQVSILTFILTTSTLILLCYYKYQTQQSSHQNVINIGIEPESRRWIVNLQRELSRRNNQLQQRIQNQIRAEEETQTLSDELRRLERKTIDLTDRITCIVCQERERDLVILPCKHLCLCHTCADKICASKDKTCPVCRQKISDTVEFYL